MSKTLLPQGQERCQDKSQGTGTFAVPPRQAPVSLGRRLE